MGGVRRGHRPGMGGSTELGSRRQQTADAAVRRAAAAVLGRQLLVRDARAQPRLARHHLQARHCTAQVRFLLARLQALSYTYENISNIQTRVKSM